MTAVLRKASPAQIVTLLATMFLLGCASVDGDGPEPQHIGGADQSLVAATFSGGYSGLVVAYGSTTAVVSASLSYPDNYVISSTMTFDWGDGSPPQEVDLYNVQRRDQGTPYAVHDKVIAGHTYASPGRRDIRVVWRTQNFAGFHSDAVHAGIVAMCLGLPFLCIPNTYEVAATLSYDAQTDDAYDDAFYRGFHADLAGLDPLAAAMHYVVAFPSEGRRASPGVDPAFLRRSDPGSAGLRHVEVLARWRPNLEASAARASVELDTEFFYDANRPTFDLLEWGGYTAVLRYWQRVGLAERSGLLAR
jgi:hypothetical protein